MPHDLDHKFRPNSPCGTVAPGSGIPGLNLMELGRNIGLRVYIWLKDGSEFWAVPVSMDSRDLWAYVWRGDKWDFTRLSIENIDSYI